MKSRYYQQFTEQEILVGYETMYNELLDSRIDGNHLLFEIFNQAWISFIENKWSYDGASFTNERYNHTLFEVASFIHDWRNSFGYVAYYIDKEMFMVMILLNYDLSDILKRYFLTRLTFVNILRHKILGSYNKQKPKLYLK